MRKKSEFYWNTVVKLRKKLQFKKNKEGNYEKNKSSSLQSTRIKF